MLKKLRAISQRETLSAILSLMNSNMLVAIVGALISIIQARFVTADQLGFFRQFSIITNYLFFLHLGTFHAVEKMYPYYIGQGNSENARRIVAVAGAWITFVSASTSVIFFLLAISSFIRGDWMRALGWLAQSVAMLTMVYGGFIKATYRSGQDFKSLAKAQLLIPIYTILIVPIYFLSPYTGLFLKNINLLPATIAMYIKRPIKVKASFTFKEFGKLLKEGLPRFSSSYMMTTGLDAVRSTVILQQLGQVSLGYWSFSWTILGLLKQIPQAISAVYAPKVIREYGYSNNYKSCLKMCRKPILVSLLILLIVIPIAVFCFILIIPTIIPNYADTSGVLCMMTIVMLPICVLDIPWSIINAMNKLAFMNIFSAIDLAVQLGGMLLAVQFGLGLYSVVVGFALGSIIRGAAIVCFFLHQNRIIKHF